MYVRRHTIAILATLALALTPGAAPLFAQKTDVIIMVNGDHVTGEIKTLDRGRLTYKTDDMGTLSVKWDKVLRVTSRDFFELELQAGDKYFGELSPGLADRLLVVSLLGVSDTLAMEEIVRIAPIEATFFQRVDGYIDLGFTYQSANKNTLLTLGAEARYRGRKWSSKATLTSYVQSTEAQEAAITSNTISLEGQRFLGNRWSALSSIKLEQDDEQELDRRILTQAGGGLFFLQTNRALAQASAGLTWSNERYTGTGSVANSMEAFVTADAAYFQLDSPKTDLTGKLSFYPSLTDWGRVRIDFESRLSHELFSDFTIVLSISDKYDSRPGSTTTEAQNTFGTTLSIGYTF